MVSGGPTSSPRWSAFRVAVPAPIAIKRLASPRRRSRCAPARTSRSPAPIACDGGALAVSIWVWLAPGRPARRGVARWSRAGATEGPRAGRWCSTPSGGRASRWRAAAASTARSRAAAAARSLVPGRGTARPGGRDRLRGALRRRGGGPGGLRARERPRPAAPARRPGRCCSAPSNASRAGRPSRTSTASSRRRASSPAGPGAELRARARAAGRAVVNGPLRAVTGRRWSGDVHDWRWARRPVRRDALPRRRRRRPRLGADIRGRIAGDCPSGVYAVVLAAGGARGCGPVRRRRAPMPAPRDDAPCCCRVHLSRLLLRARRPRGRGLDRARGPLGRAQPAPLPLRPPRGRLGVYEAILLRPLTQLRPGYRCPQHGGPHGLAQDLILLGFLERRGIEFEVLTDHDLHAEGVGGARRPRAR